MRPAKAVALVVALAVFVGLMLAALAIAFLSLRQIVG